MANLVSFGPLMRSSIGFDRFNDLFESLMDTGGEDRFESYPPYNIEKIGDEEYRIVMAVAGFTMEDLNITVHGDSLLINGRKEEKDSDAVTYLHRGIGTRAFQRSFRLADHVEVKGAEMKDGLLIIHLQREVPEEAKPRMIPIGTSGEGIKGLLTKKKN